MPLPQRVWLDDFPFLLAPRRQIDFSSPRSITKIDIPGGAPEYQDMGEDEHTINWGGVLEGVMAYNNLLWLEKIKAKGTVVKFKKGLIVKSVRVKELHYSVVRDDYIEYSINLIEIQKKSANSSVVSSESTGAQITSTNTSGVVDTQQNNKSATTATTTTSKTYKVSKGDTLWAISQKYLGDGNRWKEIATLNNIKDPRLLQVGVLLKLPN